jgi:hypothetical protein
MPPFIVTLCIHSLAGGASTRPKTLQDIHLSEQEGFVPNMGSKLTSAAEDGSNILGIPYLCRNPNPKPPQSESTTRNPIQLPLHEFKTQKFPLQAYPMNPSHAPIQPACLHTNPAPSDPQIVEKKARIHSTTHLISPRPLPQLTDEKMLQSCPLPATQCLPHRPSPATLLHRIHIPPQA